MVKSRKSIKRTKAKKVSKNSDEDSDFSVPDANSKEYFEDEIDEYLDSRDKILLEDVDLSNLKTHSGSKRKEKAYLDTLSNSSQSDGEDEYFLSDEEIVEYEKKLAKVEKDLWKKRIGSDIEDSDEEVEEKEEGWGKRSRWYGDPDGEGLNSSEEDMELEEAEKVRKKFAEEMADVDFDLESFQESLDNVNIRKEGAVEVVPNDASGLTKREKRRLDKLKSPEYAHILRELQEKMQFFRENISPSLKLVDSGKFSFAPEGVRLLKAYGSALTLFLLNANFYFVLHKSGPLAGSHPIFSRLIQCKELVARFEQLFDDVKNDFSLLLKWTKDLDFNDDSEVTKIQRRIRQLLRGRKTVPRNEKIQKKRSVRFADTSQLANHTVNKQTFSSSEREALEFYDMMKDGRGTFDKECEEEMEIQESNSDGPEDVEAGEKRPISYEIEKNKGLTPRRKKIQGNPRMKHKLKYKKALIKRKGQTPKVRKETSRYGGEMSGIRSGVVKSVRFRN